MHFAQMPSLILSTDGKRNGRGHQQTSLLHRLRVERAQNQQVRELYHRSGERDCFKMH